MDMLVVKHSVIKVLDDNKTGCSQSCNQLMESESNSPKNGKDYHCAFFCVRLSYKDGIIQRCPGCLRLAKNL